MNDTKNNNLQITSSKLPLAYRNPLQHLVTALPYADEEINDPLILN